MNETGSSRAIDRLLDRAVEAVNRGDLARARDLAEEVLVADATNPEAALLTSGPSGPPGGQLRRLTVMFCDLVGSTGLSARHDPEQYRHILGHYKRACHEVIEDTHEGHIAQVKGDGLLVLFGHPTAHEDDVLRAVRAGLDVVAAIRRLSARAERDIGETLAARVAVHRGLVYLDPEEDDVYGLAANVAARLQELAPPASVVVSDAVLALVGERFETRAQEPQKVKGLDDPLASWRIVRERLQPRDRSGRWTTPLVGRDEPLRRLRQAWHDRPGTVLVRGEAGIGKTRLVATLADEVAAEGGHVVQITAALDAADAGFQALRGLIERHCGIRAPHSGGERLRRLRSHLVGLGLDPDQLVPLLAPVLGVDPDAGYTAAAADARKLLADIADGLDGFLHALLGRGATLLVVEDSQWLDSSTLGVLSRMRGTLPDQVLLVMTTRDHAIPLPVDAVIDLTPLSPQECQELVDALDPGAVTMEERAELVARSDGMPLYLEHLVRAAIDVRPAVTSQPSSSGTGTVPDALYEPLAARLGATQHGLQVAGAAATMGREVDQALLARVADVDGVVVDRVVTALVDGSVLDPPAQPGGPYRFRHEMLREVAYELQPPSARRQAHSRAADALVAAASDAGPDWLTLAGHYERARRHRAAVDCYRQSAEQARRRGALAEARVDLDRALDLLRDVPQDPQGPDREVELRLRRAFLAVSTEGNASPGAASDYQRCLELATTGRSSDSMFTTLIALWGHYASRGDLDRARQVLETLRTVLAEGREWALPENEAGVGILDWYAGRFRDAGGHLERAACASEARSDDGPVRSEWFLPNDPRTAIYTHLGLARFVRGDPTGAAIAFGTADDMAAALPFPQGPFSAAYNMTYASWTRIQMGDHAAAARAIDRVQALADRHGFDFWSLAAATQRAELAAARACSADPADQDAVAATANLLAGLVAGWQMIDTRVFLPTVLTTWAATLGAAGDRQAAAERCAEALDLAGQTGARFCTADTLRVQAHLATDPAQVDEGLRTALQVATNQGAVAFQLRIARDLYVHRGAAARPALRDALDLFPADASYPELDTSRALLT